MAKKVITLPDTPVSPIPSSPAVKAGDYIFLAGQIGIEDDKGREVKGVEAQTRQCLENMKRVLEVAGASLDDVVKVTVFLVNVDDVAKMNQVYKRYFLKDYPARLTAIAALTKPAMLVEMECVAYRP